MRREGEDVKRISPISEQNQRQAESLSSVNSMAAK